MRCAIVSSMLSVLKICMDCLDLKNRGEMGKRGQEVQTSTYRSWVCNVQHDDCSQWYCSVYLEVFGSKRVGLKTCRTKICNCV